MFEIEKGVPLVSPIKTARRYGSPAHELAGTMMATGTRIKALTEFFADTNEFQEERARWIAAGDNRSVTMEVSGTDYVLKLTDGKNIVRLTGAIANSHHIRHQFYMASEWLAAVV